MAAKQTRHTFSEICGFEPKIVELYRSIPRIINCGHPLEHNFWQQWLVVKRRAVRLVGWDAMVREVANDADYDTVIRELLFLCEREYHRDLPETEDQ